MVSLGSPQGEMRTGVGGVRREVRQAEGRGADVVRRRQEHDLGGRFVEGRKLFRTRTGPPSVGAEVHRKCV